MLSPAPERPACDRTLPQTCAQCTNKARRSSGLRPGRLILLFCVQPMPVDPDLLEILVCPRSKAELEVVALPSELCAELVEKYREHFRDEDPLVEEGLYCAESALVYPIVSDIPIMLIDEALPAASIGR